MSLAVDQVAAFHPPEVMDALWRGLSERDAGVALLTYLHGRADCVFDLAQRPFFLTFNTADPDRRAAAVAALRERLAGASLIPHADTTP